MSMRIFICFCSLRAGLGRRRYSHRRFDQGAEHGSEQVRLSNVDGIPCCTAQELNRALTPRSARTHRAAARLTLYDEQFVFLGAVRS
jgi:hypothetical protein